MIIQQLSIVHSEKSITYNIKPLFQNIALKEKQLVHSKYSEPKIRINLISEFSSKMNEIRYKSSLPQIRERRVNTEGRQPSKQRLNKVVKQNSLCLKSNVYKNQYLQKLLQKEKEYARVKKIYYLNHNVKYEDQSEKIMAKINKVMNNKHNEMKQKQKQNNGTEKTNCTSTEISKKVSRNAYILSQTENYYNQHLKNQSPTREKIIALKELLQTNNYLFQKTNPIITETILKMGQIVTFQQGQVIYKEYSPIRNIGILLWGQVVLKKKSTKFKFICEPGTAIGEELIFQKLDYNFNRRTNIEKGQFFTSQKCKAQTNCGILFIGELEYNLIYQQLTKQGYKDIIQRFQSLLLRTYLKKRQHRNQLG